MRLIDADNFGNRMYHEAFEKDSDMQKWDSGCWIRYRLFENVLREQPTVNPEPHWIPVSERLPEPRIDVWCNSDLGQMVGYYDETVEAWYGRDYLELMVTAWMPLPEPYREEERDE